MVVEPVDLGLGRLVERPGRGGEDRPVGVFLVVGLQGHPDGLGRTVHLPADPAGDLDQAGLADRRHPPGPADDLLALGVAEPLEPGPAVDLVAVGLDEPRQARLQERDLGLALDDEPAGDQPLAPPPGDRPGRDVVPPAHLGHGQDRLGRLVDRLAQGGGKPLDVEPEVGPDPDPVEDQRRGDLGTESGDPEEEVFERIPLLRVDLGEELLGTVELVQDPVAGGEPGLLLLEVAQGLMAVSTTHGVAPMWPRRGIDRPSGSVREGEGRAEGRSGGRSDPTYLPGRVEAVKPLHHSPGGVGTLVLLR